jgi:hypothetical protein
MSWDAYVFGELRWPMPDPGLVAVWRAMAIDASRWSDWDGFVDGVGAGTIAALVDGGAPDNAPAELTIDEHGVKLRACVEHAHADWWQRLAIAWRLAADLDAKGELVWIAGGGGAGSGVAYRAVVGDGGSRWEKLTGAAATAIDALPGRQEVASLARAALARHAPPAKAAPTPAPAKPAKRATTARPVASKPAPAKKAKPARKPTRAAKRKR